MDDAGFINDAARDDAKATRPRIVRDTGTPSSGYFVDWVISRIPGYVGNVDEPIVVETTFDVTTQQKAERAVAQGLGARRPRICMRMKRRWSRCCRTAPCARWSAAVPMPTAPSTARPMPLRQPGSAFKPFVYLDGIRTRPHARRRQ